MQKSVPATSSTSVGVHCTKYSPGPSSRISHGTATSGASTGLWGCRWGGAGCMSEATPNGHLECVWRLLHSGPLSIHGMNDELERLANLWRWYVCVDQEAPTHHWHSQPIFNHFHFRMQTTLHAVPQHMTLGISCHSFWSSQDHKRGGGVPTAGEPVTGDTQWWSRLVKGAKKNRRGRASEKAGWTTIGNC